MKQIRKNQDLNTCENAISPVVGVMLMLVVTIIVAAVIATFAGGLFSNEQPAPHANLEVTYKADIVDTDKTNDITPDYGAGAPINNGITFKHLSGDSFDLENIKIILVSGGTSITFTNGSILRDDTSVVVNPSLLNILGGGSSYFAVPKGMDKLINVGETFTLLADGYYDNTQTVDAKNKGKFLFWKPQSGGWFVIKKQTPVTYTVFDTISGKQIQTGSFILQ